VNIFLKIKKVTAHHKLNCKYIYKKINKKTYLKVKSTRRSTAKKG